jgi:hypothetical protein
MPSISICRVVLLAQLGETRSARTHLEDAIASARALGSRMMLAVALAMHGETLRLEGELAGAEGDLRTALELVDENAVGPTQLVAGLLEALVDQGDLKPGNMPPVARRRARGLPDVGLDGLTL